MTNKGIESSKQLLLHKINEGRKYLEKERYDYNELIRLRNQLEKKKTLAITQTRRKKMKIRSLNTKK